MNIKSFFGYSNKAPLSRTLLFYTKHDTFMPMVITDMNISLRWNDAPPEVEVKLKAYTDMSARELLTEWFAGHWTQVDDDLQGLSQESILAHAITSLPDSSLPTNGVFRIEVETTKHNPTYIQTLGGVTYQAFEPINHTESFMIYMPDGRLIERRDPLW